MGSLPLEAMMPLDPETFAGESGAVVGFLADYYRNVDKYPVMANPEPGSIRKLLPDAAPELGESMDRILDDVQRDILPGLTHWQSPSFFAYFPANASSAGFAGEMLSAGLNVVPFVWTASPVATELEQVVVEWLASLLGLPERFHFKGGGGGVLHGSTCEAVVCTLAAARDRALSKLGHEGILKLVVYASDQTHATFQKGASNRRHPSSKLPHPTDVGGVRIRPDCRHRPKSSGGRRRPRTGSSLPVRHNRHYRSRGH
jgi:tyrosine decarboxylase